MTKNRNKIRTNIDDNSWAIDRYPGGWGTVGLCMTKNRNAIRTKIENCVY